MKFANMTGVVAGSQGELRLTRGMTADDDHWLVLERPELFDDELSEVVLPGPARQARQRGEVEPAPARRTGR